MSESTGHELATVPEDATVEPVPRSLSGDAWHDLRGSVVFWVAGVVVILMLSIAVLPGSFSSVNAKTAACSLSESLQPPSADHWFGFDKRAATSTRESSTARARR